MFRTAITNQYTNYRNIFESNDYSLLCWFQIDKITAESINHTCSSLWSGLRLHLSTSLIIRFTTILAKKQKIQDSELWSSWTASSVRFVASGVIYYCGTMRVYSPATIESLASCDLVRISLKRRFYLSTSNTGLRFNSISIGLWRTKSALLSSFIDPSLPKISV